MCTQMNRRRGFTLVEILAVLVIIGIASAIVVPQLGTRDDLRAAAAARVIVADLIYAQNMAISGQKTIYVRFDTASNSYKLLSTAATGGDVIMSHPMTQLSYQQNFGSSSKGLESVTLSSVDFDGIDSLYTNDFTLAFDEMGAPYAFDYTQGNKSDLKNGSIVLTSGTFTTTITVSPYTGEILVQ
jgi:prepilin-type N-terminal cleavage/methylation domain-containing protein